MVIEVHYRVSLAIDSTLTLELPLTEVVKSLSCTQSFDAHHDCVKCTTSVNISCTRSDRQPPPVATKTLHQFSVPGSFAHVRDLGARTEQLGNRIANCMHAAADSPKTNRTSNLPCMRGSPPSKPCAAQSHPAVPPSLLRGVFGGQSNISHRNLQPGAFGCSPDFPGRLFQGFP